MDVLELGVQSRTVAGLMEPLSRGYSRSAASLTRVLILEKHGMSIAGNQLGREAVQKERSNSEKLSISSSRTPIRDLLTISTDGDPALDAG